MGFEFLKQVAVDDTTTDFNKAYSKCLWADDCLKKGNTNQCIDLYFQALKTVVRAVYKWAGLPEPKVSHPEKGPAPSFIDRIDRSSPFAGWLDNQKILDLCHELRKKSASFKSENKEASAAEASSVGEQLGIILEYICGKLPKISFSNPNGFHQPCVILLDVSGSMLGAKGTPEGERPIDELNVAILNFKDDLISQERINACTEVAFITFSDEIEVIQPFRNANKFNIPLLSAGGKTAMNQAIEKALEIIEKQKEIYHREEVDYYRPWVFLFSDGMANDVKFEASAKAKLRDAIEGNHVAFYPVRIGRWANKESLLSYYPESAKEKIVITAEQGHFKELFRFLSNSIKASIENGVSSDAAMRALVKGVTGVNLENT